ncbi:MAG TPA: fused MFS/spermidine synthase [Myxococcota bacterium]
MKFDLRFGLILLCFFLSGFAALLYETAWAREFAFLFGTSELAVLSVLAAYMAGLAAGAAAVARFVTRVRRPVLVYGLLELGIAASALAVPYAIRAALWLQAAVLGGRAAPPDEANVAGGLFYVACSFAILIVPTGLMGATLPLLARHAVRREEEIGRRVGALYALNTAGAVAGTLVTGFVLLPALGLRETVYIGAATNAVVFGAAALLARRAPAPADVAQARPRAARLHWVLPLVALSGLASFTYEVIWMRLLGYLLGGSIQAFATMLASFLLGIALGSAAGARLARSAEWAGRGFALAQIGTAALSLLAFAGAGRLPDLARALGAGSSGSQAANALIAVLGLLPGTLCIGAVFPFAVRLLARGAADAAPATARVYAWSTLGAISGALLSGYALLPALRFAGALGAAVALNLLLALGAACLLRPASRGLAAVAAAGIGLLVLLPPSTPWSVLRYRASGEGGWDGDVAYYGVGRSSTVLLFDQGSAWRLTTNGLPESEIDRGEPAPDRHPTARWLAMLPVLLRPEARSMLVVGLGGGLTVESLPSTLEAVHVIELEPEVARAHERLAELRGASPLHDPRVQLVVNDARGALLLTDARFDAVVSQPSHPWTAGASHLYTREFFSLVAQHLEPGGIFVQWIGLAYVDGALLRSLVATLRDVFPHVSLFQPAQGAVLFAASDAPIDPVGAPARALARAPEDFGRFGLQVIEDVAATWAISAADAQRFAADARINTDDRNELATRSAGLGDTALRVSGGSRLLARYDPLRSADAPLDRGYLVRRLAARDETLRAVRLASSLPDPVERLTALGWAKSAVAPRRAIEHFRLALERDATAQSARFGLLRAQRRALEPDAAAYRALAEPLQGAAAAVVEGWVHASAHDWSALRALEPALAGADVRDPSYRDALQLRVQWRSASADPALREQALGIAGELLRGEPSPEEAVTAARAFAAAGLSGRALQVLDYLSRSPSDVDSLRAALALLDSLAAEAEARQWSGLRERLERRPE